MRSETARCAIAGGGPAGMMLGLLLARIGVDVLVLEKHADFLRDFRGDTIHPSTLEVMHEIGLLDELLELPHQEVRTLCAQIGDETVAIADFTHLPTRCRFIAFMPQWDFLNFLADRGGRLPSFKLAMEADVTGLIEEAGAVTGLRANTADGPLEVRAPLVVGADGRHSIVRKAADLGVDELGAPMDVLWFRISRRPDDVQDTMGRFESGNIVVLINRGDYWQCGLVIPKGSLERLQERGIDAFRRRLGELVPFAANRTSEIADWTSINLLTVRVDRLRRWYRPGLLCIGDAAHAMSPIGGVGINLAIQDAVAAANLLAAPLATNRLTTDDLARVQRRRELPTRITQGIQLLAQKRIVTSVLAADEKLAVPFPVRMLDKFPALRRIPARLVGLGIRPEHVAAPVTMQR
jgi:2-polyprenyl-6-methoxyphenol hydroxylase-like FAD-dependent oxidoreductase